LARVLASCLAIVLIVSGCSAAAENEAIPENATQVGEPTAANGSTSTDEGLSPCSAAVFQKGGPPQTIEDFLEVLQFSLDNLNSQGGVQNDLANPEKLVFNPEAEPFFVYASWEWDEQKKTLLNLSARSADKLEADAFPGLYRKTELMREFMDPNSGRFDPYAETLYSNLGAENGFFFFDPDTSQAPTQELFNVIVGAEGLITAICSSAPDQTTPNYGISYGLTAEEQEAFAIALESLGVAQ
jgi:hypothetical protein